MSWVLMVAFGVACLFTMKKTPPAVDFVLIRIAAASFAGAGVVGVDGWLGGLLQSVVGWVIGLLNTISADILGTTVSWILVAGVGALWVGALLPDRVFGYDFPDWLMFSGVILPTLVGTVPGRAGDFLDTVMTTAGQYLNTGVEQLF